MTSAATRLAIVGCGAITGKNHLPASQLAKGVEVAALVDPDLERAQRLAEEFGVDACYASDSELSESVDGAVLALPHHLHEPVAVGLLKRGIHVLVEKPMARTIEECQRMIDAASETGVVLAVGHYRRFFASVRRLRELLQQGALGTGVTYEFEEGRHFSWPSQSRFVFDKEKAGGGALMDAGVHGLDLVSWLFGPPEGIEYEDDAFGGMEANALCRLRHPRGVTGTIELSRTRQLTNEFKVGGSDATIALGVWVPGQWRIVEGTLPAQYVAPPKSPNLADDAFSDQLMDFAAAIRGESGPAVDGAVGSHPVALAQECYANRRPMRLPWLDVREVTSL